MPDYPIFHEYNFPYIFDLQNNRPLHRLPVYSKDSKTNVKVYARKLKKAKKLYVQVRGYKIVGGKKVYGLWSGKKKVKK